MISKDIQIVDIDPDHIQNVYDYITRGNSEKKSILFILYKGNKILTAIHSEKGPLSDLPFADPDRLEEVAKHTTVDYILCCESRIFRTVTANFQIAVNWQDDFIRQLACLIRSVKEFVGRGIYIYPKNIQNLLDFPIDKFMEFSRFLMPRKLLFALAVFDGDNIWTSLIMMITKREITLITTTDHLKMSDNLNREEKFREIILNLRKCYKMRPYLLILDKSLFKYIISSPNPFKSMRAVKRMFFKYRLPIYTDLMIFLLSLKEKIL